MARFFVSKKDLRGKTGRVSGEELEHMRRVLRLRPGDQVTLFDDQGWEHEGVIRVYTDEFGEVEILSSARPERESPLEITLAQALGKGEKMDWVVEKATELGVRRIVPFFSSRTVPRLDRERLERRKSRWEKIALAAVKQSGRGRIPEILPAGDFTDLIGRPWECQLKLFFWEGESGQKLAQIRRERDRLDSILLVIGPEGGFSPAEATEAKRCGFQPVSLGKRILRTETAALAALSIVQCLWGDIG